MPPTHSVGQVQMGDCTYRTVMLCVAGAVTDNPTYPLLQKVSTSRQLPAACTDQQKQFQRQPRHDRGHCLAMRKTALVWLCVKLLRPLNLHSNTKGGQSMHPRYLLLSSPVCCAVSNHAVATCLPTPTDLVPERHHWAVQSVHNLLPVEGESARSAGQQVIAACRLRLVRHGVAKQLGQRTT